MKWTAPLRRFAREPASDRSAPPNPGAPGSPQGGRRLLTGRTWLWFAAIILLNFAIAKLLVPEPEAPVAVPYTLFKSEVGKGNVEAIYSRGETISGRFVTPVPYSPAAEREATGTGGRLKLPTPKPSEDPTQVTNFTTTLPVFVDPGLETFLIENGVQIMAEPLPTGRSPWATLLFGFGPALLIIGFYLWLLRRMQQGPGMGAGLMGIGKSKARRYDQQKDEKVTFEDVAGIDEAENELVEIVDFLKNPPERRCLPGRLPERQVCRSSR
jgi:cell division protease FtsH